MELLSGAFIFSSASFCEHSRVSPSFLLLLLSFLQPDAGLWPEGICYSTTSVPLALLSPSMPRERRPLPRAPLCVAPLWLPPLSAPMMLLCARPSKLQGPKCNQALFRVIKNGKCQEGLKYEISMPSKLYGVKRRGFGAADGRSAALNYLTRSLAAEM